MPTLEHDLRLALVQTHLVWHDAGANRQRIEQQLQQLRQPADLIVLPEMFTTGFSMDAPSLAEPDGGPSAQWLLDQARRHGALVTGSIITESQGAYYNRMYWAFPDGSLRHYDKRHLFRMAGEQNAYTAGDAALILEWRGWRINALVCYDLRFPVWARNRYDGSADCGYDLIVCIANWPERRRWHWRRLLQARGIENLAYVAGVNRVGVDGNGIAYSGDTMLCDWHGEPLGELVHAEGVLETSLSYDALTTFRDKFPAWEDRDAFTLS